MKITNENILKNGYVSYKLSERKKLILYIVVAAIGIITFELRAILGNGLAH